MEQRHRGWWWGFGARRRSPRRHASIVGLAALAVVMAAPGAAVLHGMPSPFVSQAAASSGRAMALPLYSFGPATGGSFYITIDDGTTPDERVVGLMASAHVPVTTFLVEQAIDGNVGFWQDFARAGGVIEDHTVSHPVMTQLTFAQQVAQWATPRAAYAALFGAAPALGRPPYGTYNASVVAAAAEAGLSGIVLWSASMSTSGLQTYDHGPLRAGEIVLLHWVPGLYGQLVALRQVAATLGLHPAPLPWVKPVPRAVGLAPTPTS